MSGPTMGVNPIFMLMSSMGKMSPEYETNPKMKQFIDGIDEMQRQAFESAKGNGKKPSASTLLTTGQNMMEPQMAMAGDEPMMDRAATQAALMNRGRPPMQQPQAHSPNAPISVASTNVGQRSYVASGDRSIDVLGRRQQMNGARTSLLGR